MSGAPHRVTDGLKNMQPIRIVALGGICLAMVGTWYAVSQYMSAQQQPKAVVQQKDSGPKIELVEVLIANTDIPMGNALAEADVRWQQWPSGAVMGQFVLKRGNNDKREILGTLARASFVAGEPIVKSKLATPGQGFLSSILPAGMRAISLEISAENGAGGFILPNDRVDLLLTRRETLPGATVSFISETVMTNIRVLAIDQRVQEQNGQKAVVGRTATLELTPEQAETLAVSRQMGSISLALRSLADMNKLEGETAPEQQEAKRSTTVVKYGVSSQVTGR
jgi:pilus assembly protein CpaB